MTKLEALKELLAKVETSETVKWNVSLLIDELPIDDMVKAHNGSLDAAKALHEAVLPGWGWIVKEDGQVDVYSPDCEKTSWSFLIDSPARAWLIAILRALIAKEQEA